MNVAYKHQGISFEWDSRKATGNLLKHDIQFQLACESFFDHFVLYLDAEIVGDEERETLIGLTADWRLLFVVYVMRQNSIRIISARLATKAEREQYENH